MRGRPLVSNESSVEATWQGVKAVNHAVHIAWRAESTGQYEGDVHLLPTK